MTTPGAPAATPLLSVVIPSYDTAAMTIRCCEAALAAAPPGSELIVVDDGSRDGTADVLARDVPAVRIVRLDSNRGYAAAANRGVAVAHGRIVLLLNSDALVERASLRAIVQSFDADPSLGIAGARLFNEDGSPQWSGGRTPTLPWMLGVVSGAGPLARFFRIGSGDAATRDVDWVSGAAIAFRREVWDAAGPLTERFLFYCQDIVLCLRAREAGWRVRIVGDARVTHGLGRTITGGRAEPHDPGLLWTDLFRWGSAHYGARWSAWARALLLSAAGLRIAWRKVRRPFSEDAETAALMRAMRRLAQSDS